jgi:PAS domain S-box
MLFPIQFWHPRNDQALLIMGDYNLGLVLLSILVVIFAAFIALLIVHQAQQTTQPLTRKIMRLASGIGLGGGIWSMHFIGMLAVQFHSDISYNLPLTFLSLLPGIMAASLTLFLLKKTPPSFLRICLGGALFGSGIAVMHLTGVSAIQTDAAVSYDASLLWLSVGIGILFSTLALWLFFGASAWLQTVRYKTKLLVSSVLIGTATVGMHYTCMAALRLIALPHQEHAITNVQPEYLSLVIALITLVVILLIAASSGLMHYRDMLAHLRNSENRFRSVIDTAGTGIIITDSRGHIQQFNHAAETIFGWKAEEIKGKNVNRLTLMPLLLSRMVYSQQQNTNPDKTWVIQGIHKSGRTFPLQLSVGYMQIPGEALFVGFVEDISERHQIEEALRDSEQQFRSLISNMPGVSYRALPEDDRPLVFVSDAVLELTGYPATDFINKRNELNFNNLIHPDDWERVQETVADGVWARQHYTIEYRLKHRNGEYRWVWEHGSSVFDERGQLIWLDGVIFDISERHAMEQALLEAKNKAEQAAATKTAFLANMSHEIRTPMNAIIGFTEVVLASELKKEQQQHLLTIRQSAKSLLRLLNDILDTAKMERGNIELESLNFSIAAVLQELIAESEGTARGKGLQLHLQMADDLPPYLKGDPLRLKQILNNLVSNAIKFTEHGEVTLSVSKEEERLHFLIQDTGVGIATERQNRIFDAFTQADASVTRRFGGTGLGTTICKQLVELMQGEIWLESEVGNGTKFHVLLPIVVGEEPKPEHQQGALNLPPLNILVTDDVQQNLDLLELILRELGHKVSLAHDGQEAVDLAQQRSFDLILMDIQMPGMDGLTATRLIRQNQQENHQPRIPIIALTASVFQDDRYAAQEAGMDGFASKPIDIEKLMQEIAHVLHLDLTTQPAPSPSATTEPQAEIHDIVMIPGLNYQQGLKIWRQPQAYRQALLHFADEYQTSFSELQTLFTDAEQGRYYAHKLKGVCNNLALKQLASLAQELEGYCRAHQLIDIALIRKLSDLLNKTAQALHNWGNNKPIPMTDNSKFYEIPLDSHALLKAALELKEALQHGELNENALQTIAQILPDKEQDTGWIALQHAVNSFDFDEALQLLERICQPYQITETTHDYGHPARITTG